MIDLGRLGLEISVLKLHVNLRYLPGGTQGSHELVHRDEFTLVGAREFSNIE